MRERERERERATSRVERGRRRSEFVFVATLSIDNEIWHKECEYLSMKCVSDTSFDNLFDDQHV
mgnify:CR=1 FL=1